jgi:hypothetical protein
VHCTPVHTGSLHCESNNSGEQINDRIHGSALHVKSKNPNAMPLILTHGWPGSIVEFLKLIGLLTDPVRSEETSKIHLTSSCRRCPGLGSPKSRPKQGGLFPVSQLRG